MAGASTEAFKPIGRRLAKLRGEKGLSQRTLAERLGRPRSYVDRLELAERRLDVVDVQNLARALDVAPAELFVLLTSEDN